jgi:peptidoglycan/xylan/chitin deacetylase (PgdA/CDA1 family)
MGTAATQPTTGEMVKARVLPWNGYQAAVSLTYDDGDPAHLEIAIPEMDKRQMKGTFFLVGNRISQATNARWKKAFDSGHEAAHHSMSHPQPKGLSAEQLDVEVAGAHEVLEKTFGHRVVTYAYPYGAITPELVQRLEGRYVACRVGLNLLQSLNGPLDWMNIPSMVTLTALTLSDYEGWITRTLEQGAWCVVMVHGIEWPGTGWEPMPRQVFDDMLDMLAQRRQGLWIATFAEVGSYLRAQKEFEKAVGSVTGQTTKWCWQRPEVIPPGVVLKVTLEGLGQANAQVRQGGEVIEPDGAGIYATNFDAGELSVTKG